MSDKEKVQISDEKKKAHRKKHAGRKVKQQTSSESTQNGQNAKAFAFHSAVKAERRFRHKQDIETKRQHVPIVDRTPVEIPPLLVGVVGPPKVGKTTLINSLIKLFTKSPLTNIKGPVTIIVGRKRRITLLECNNDINSMIDLAKVADLVLLLCDASFGFEMEIFEFLNICQVHGMPRIMGVLTHLDMIKNVKALKTTKKTLKHRFWTEVYPGAKLFYLSGILHGEYLTNEIKNLGRFISVIKLRPLMWRTSHSYLLGDRYEDLTSQELIRKNPKCDRKISLYGYVRGIPISKNVSVHIAGLGDLKIHNISFLPDPCPLPETVKKRALIEKEKLIYAPFSGVGGIVYDKDAVYVELAGSHSHTERGNENEIVANLIDTKETLDVKMERSELQLFTGGTKLTAQDIDEPKEVLTKTSENSDEDEEEVENEEEEREEETNFSSEDESDDDDDDDDDEDDDDDDDIKWKANLAKKAHDSFLNRQTKTQNLMKIVYGVFDIKEINSRQTVQEGDGNEIGGLFRPTKTSTTEKNMFESALFESWKLPHKNWLEPDNKSSIANCFVTGRWKESEDAGRLLELDDAEVNYSDESDAFGDFEDLETGEKYTATPDQDDHNAKGTKRKAADSPDKNETLAEKKRKLKEKFNAEYDNTDKNYYDELKLTAEKQSEMNKTVFENVPDDVRVQVEGYRPGMYVRLEFLDVPAEFINNFDPTYPLVVGALNVGEENVGYVNVKVKKHRWYKRILKSNDPLVISFGWRRFQTLPIYSKLEDDLKFRYLKYTPQHVTCNAHFWGPITPQGTGFLALQSCSEDSQFAMQGFRIAATGAVQELDRSTKIMKKLKLIGYPYQIYKKTAFIKGMFNSALEVVQFEGAQIKTVSGIRGQIKKVCAKPEGSFRATFEDKIQLSDIVFCRTWFRVDVTQFYNPVITLLLPHEAKNSWKGARTTGQIKRDQGIRNDANFDSLYTEVEREPRPSKSLVIPRKLQQALSYRDKPKHDVLPSEKGKSEQRVAVIREPHEQKVSNMMKMLRATFEDKQHRTKIATKERMEQHKQSLEQQEMRKMKKLKEQKRNVIRMKSKAQRKSKT